MNPQEMALGANIVLTNARESVTEEDTLDEKAVLVFKLALNESCTWFVNTDNDRFMVGIVALTALVEDEETKERIKQEVQFLQALNMSATGIPIDLGSMLGGMEPIGLQRLFEEAKGAPAER